MEEKTKFEIRDRRTHFTDDTDQTAQKPKENVQSEHPPTAGGAAPAEKIDAAMPVSFSSFILSLATSALIHLGQGAPSQGGGGTVALPLARQVIDLIALLSEKTKGNLTKEEEEMISQTLFALQIKFVEIEKKRRS